MKKQTFLLIMNFILIVLTIFPAPAGFAQEVSPEVLRDVGSQFVCNCNCGTQIDPLDETQCPTAKVFRKELEQLILAGKTKEEIRDHYVAQFGESILKAPLKSGFSLTAWIFPFISLLAGGGAILYLMKVRMKKYSPATNVEHTSQSEKDLIKKELFEELVEKERKKYL